MVILIAPQELSTYPDANTRDRSKRMGGEFDFLQHRVTHSTERAFITWARASPVRLNLGFSKEKACAVRQIAMVLSGLCSFSDFRTKG